MDEGSETRVAATARREQADEWALVLMAEGLSPRVAWDGGWGVWVDAAQAERAAAALAAYSRENRGGPPAPPHPVWEGEAPFLLALLVAAALLLFFLVTGPADRDSAWFEQGAAQASMLSGEPWRAITALTLHANAAHVLANAVAAALFFGLVFRVLGPGVGALLVLAAGALGNLLNAWIQPVSHVSVGASTAVFGAVGILGGVAARRRQALDAPRRRPWTTLAASLALLAMLGTGGERTDLWAHALGLLAGVLLGAGVALRAARPPGAVLQWAAALVCVGALVGAWSLARA